MRCKRSTRGRQQGGVDDLQVMCFALPINKHVKLRAVVRRAGKGKCQRKGDKAGTEWDRKGQKGGVNCYLMSF